MKLLMAFSDWFKLTPKKEDVTINQTEWVACPICNGSTRDPDDPTKKCPNGCTNGVVLQVKR